MKLKILMLPNRTYPTSEAVLEEVYANILPSRGYEIIWVMQSGEKLKKPKIARWESSCVYVTPASPGTSRRERLINHILRFIWKMYIVHKLVKDENFDIVQVRNGILEGIIATYLKKSYRIPFSFQYSFPSPEGDIYASKSGMARYPFIYHFRGKISKPVLMWIMSRADLILPISKWMMQDLVEKGIPKKKMMAFPMGVNVEYLSPKISGTYIREKLKLNNPSTIIYIGTMEQIRGLDFLLRALVVVKKEIPGIKLLMVGDGEDRTRLEKLAQSLGIKESIIFTGQVPRSKVPEYIAAADVGVSPIPPLPIYQVSSPTKLIEYMGMGKPVIGNDIPDQKEVINNSSGGICVRYDEEEFAEAIIELLNNPKKAEEMGKAGREWVVRNRSYEILARNVEQRYLDLVQSNHLKNYGTKNQKSKTKSILNHETLRE